MRRAGVNISIQIPTRLEDLQNFIRQVREGRVTKALGEAHIRKICDANSAKIINDDIGKENILPGDRIVTSTSQSFVNGMNIYRSETVNKSTGAILATSNGNPVGEYLNVYNGVGNVSQVAPQEGIQGVNQGSPTGGPEDYNAVINKVKIKVDKDNMGKDRLSGVIGGIWTGYSTYSETKNRVDTVSYQTGKDYVQKIKAERAKEEEEYNIRIQQSISGHNGRGGQ